MSPQRRSTNATARELLDEYGQTFAAEAGIPLRNGPSSLFQLLCLSLLSSARIKSSIAVAAQRALRDQGWTTPQKLRSSTWERRAKVLNEAGYARYDERTATMLADTAELLIDRYKGDLRKLREAAKRDPREERTLLKECKGIGDVGVDIFFREVQGLWPEVGPFFGKRELATAKQLGLSSDPIRLAKSCSRKDLPRLAAALVRVGTAGKDEMRQLRGAAAR